MNERSSRAVVVSSSSVTIHGPSARSRQTWVNRSEQNSVLVARSYSQRVAIRRIGACMTSIARPCLPSSIVSARVTAVTFIDFQDVAAVRLGAEIEPQRGVDIAGVAWLDVEMPGEGLDVVDRHELVQPQREQRQRQPGAISDSICGADHRLVLAEAGVDQQRGVALRQQIAVRHRIAARARRIGADPAVERERVLQGVELAFGHRAYAAGKAAGLASFPGRVFGQ